MKRILLVTVLAMVLLFGAVSAAYAVRGDSTYLTPSGSPHGAYATTTQKCGVCHAVHHATNTGQVLLEDTVGNACVYCHITSATGLISIYNGVEANYNGSDLSNAHNNFGGDPVECVDCHQVHAASSAMGANTYMTTKILKGLGATYGNTDDDADITQFCDVCHSYYETSYDTGAQTTHIMGDANASYTNATANYSGRVAWNGSNYCVSCHASGDRDQADGSVQTVASSWPHFTGGDRFLSSGATSGATAADAADSENDGVCLRCHTDGTNGIGIDF